MNKNEIRNVDRRYFFRHVAVMQLRFLVSISIQIWYNYHKLCFEGFTSSAKTRTRWEIPFQDLWQWDLWKKYKRKALRPRFCDHIVNNHNIIVVKQDITRAKGLTIELSERLEFPYHRSDHLTNLTYCLIFRPWGL